MLRINEGLGNGEVDFEVHDPHDGDYRIVRVHPWARAGNNSVYISVGTYLDEDGAAPEEIEDNYWNIIVNREDFVEGLIQTFPELKRTEEV